MAKIHEKFITKKHRVELTPEHIAAELEKRHQKYLADNKPTRASIESRSSTHVLL